MACVLRCIILQQFKNATLGTSKNMGAANCNSRQGDEVRQIPPVVLVVIKDLCIWRYPARRSRDTDPSPGVESD